MPATSDVSIEFSGARGSNTGDVFHELWAARECLRLLDSRSGLDAIKVEGTQSSDPNMFWESADCTLYFGGTSNADAERIEVQQLKYSAAKPERSWTVARISTGSNRKLETSLLRGLAGAFSQLKAERPSKDLASLRFSLVSNQPIHAKLTEAFELARAEVPPLFKGAWHTGDPDLHRLVKASGLKSPEFHEFAKLIDFDGSTGSRFAIEDDLLKAMSNWTDDEFVDATLRLRTFVRQRMMPESAGEIITRDRLLVQLGVSDDRALFPCPSQIRKVKQGVKRPVSNQLADLLRSGEQHVCLHGGAGVGKTTILQQIEGLLPAGSEMIVFDCYGGGTYLDAGEPRHRPREAFVQLCNDMASRLRMPLLLVHRDETDYAKAFRKRLDQAASLMAASKPNALLVIAVDAADNSVTAAQARGSSEISFIRDLMSFQDLPGNVRIVISARTGRMPDLHLPRDFREVILEGFTLEETAKNIRRFREAPHNWIADFHHLSSGVPRVQAYALEGSSYQLAKAIAILRPSGKNLDEIFHELFESALKKQGQIVALEQFCAGLIVLPRPVPVSDFAAVLGIPEAAVIDICSDLSPAVTRRSDNVGFADEDFEAFVRQSAKDQLLIVANNAASYFLERYHESEYAALHVATLLRQSGRNHELLDLVENEAEPGPGVVGDPVIRQEVRMQRLGHALRVCWAAGDAERALHFVLIGAESKNTKAATLSLLLENPALTVLYARDTASRMILGNPERIKDQGPLLLNLMAEAAYRKDSFAVREHWRRFGAWLSRRHDEYERAQREKRHAQPWSIAADDASCSLYAELLENGADKVIELYRGFQPPEFSTLSAKAFIERLATEQRFKEMKTLAARLPASRSVFLLVPLALAGHTVDFGRLSRGLAALLRCFKPNPEMLREFGTDNALGRYYVDTLLSAAEILAASGASNDIVRSVLKPFIDPEIRRIDKRNDHEVALIDAILRSYTLSECLEDREVSFGDIFVAAPPADDGKEPRQPAHKQNEHEQRLQELIDAIGGVYVARARILTRRVKSDAMEEVLRESQSGLQSDTWSLERNFRFSAIRARMAESMTVLLATSVSSELVADIAWSVMGNHSLLLGENLIKRLTPHSLLHDCLLQRLTEAVAKERQNRVGAEERSRNLAEFARMVAPISRDDGEAIFQQAVEIASELDAEIMDQIRLLDRLAEFGSAELNGQRRDCAIAMSRIVEDAGIRFEHYDHFPWFEALSALSRLDTPVALGCAARWHDCEVAELRDTLPPVLTIATSAGELSCATSLALSTIVTSSDGQGLKALLARAKAGGVADLVANEIAQDLLLDRLSGTNELRRFVAEHNSFGWAQQFEQQTEFRQSLPHRSQHLPPAPYSGTSRALPTLETHVWEADDLHDGRALAQQASNLLETCTAAGETLFLADVLTSARKAVPLADRRRHLEALVEMQEICPDGQVIDALMTAAQDWHTQPAVAAWCQGELPGIVARYLAHFARYLHLKDEWLAVSLELAGLSPSETQSVLLEGIQNNSDQLGAAQIFALAGIVAGHLDRSSAASLCHWYTKELASRIPPEFCKTVPKDALPSSTHEAVARFIFAFLGDIDVRVRWRSAHAIRRLARLGEKSLLEELGREYDRTTEPAFRNPAAPFYWIASRLWLVIALDRIAEEAPATIAELGDKLCEIALDEDLPHVLIRDYARDATQKLQSSGFLSIGASSANALEKVNKSPFPRAEEQDTREHSFEPLIMKGADKPRFHFNFMDTLRYWYDPWLKVFDGLTAETFLTAAEGWIIDRWGISDDESHGLQEPREKRFTGRDWQLSSHSHGSLPTMEPHRSYLEWHAMWCSVGQLLHSYPLAAPRYDSDELAFQISRKKLTHPPVWLADLVGPRPLQEKCWIRSDAAGPDWFDQIDDGEFCSELLPSDRPEYVVVDAEIDSRWQNYSETVEVSSALVSPETAPALMRALQCMESETDYGLGPENYDSDIEEERFRLRGWLQVPYDDPCLDSKDTFRNQVSQIKIIPGQRVTERLGLTLSFSPQPVWCRSGDTEACFLYEAWGAPERDRNIGNYGDDVVSAGHRLLVRKDVLEEFLADEQFDLLADVRVRRHEQNDRQDLLYTEDVAQVSFDRVVLLRGGGQIDGAERSFGAWRADCQ